jgi:PAS domain S-box-containing protein
MAQEKDSKDKQSGLRRRAEEVLGGKPSDMEDITDLSPDEVQRVVHELRVHQIELEMQNEDLRQAQIELEGLKDRYIDLYDFAPVGYVTLNEKGLIVEANLTAVRLLGLEKQKLTKMFLSHFVCQEFESAYFTHLRQVFETRSKQICEIELSREDGSQFYAQLESVAAQDEGGEFNRCRIVLSDIFERKMAEEALRESEERFRKLFEQGPIGIAIVGLDYRLVAVNGTLCEMVGYSEDELTKLTFVDITHPDDIEVDLAYVEKLSRGEIPSYRMEKRYIKKNGEVLWINLTGSIVRDEKGEAIYFLAMIEDITDRKLTEENLRKSEARLWDLYNNAPNAYFSVGTDGLIIKCNRGAEKLLGYSGEMLEGKRVFDLYVDGQEGKEKAAKVFQKFVSGEQVTNEELQMQQADGSPIWISLSVNALRDRGGNIVESRSTAVNITDRKKAEEALRDSEERYRVFF